ncbi:hypothetical protein BH09ACT7_BH09ACT7_49680 [soil metagenome]
MSTIATKFSSASTKLQVGVASVAVVAAATLTPAIAEAAPVSLAPFSQAAGNSFSEVLLLDPTTHRNNSASPAVAAVPTGPTNPVDIRSGLFMIAGAAVTFVGTVAYVGLSIVGNAVVTAGEFFGLDGLVALGANINGLANTIAYLTNAGPYA